MKFADCSPTFLVFKFPCQICKIPWPWKKNTFPWPVTTLSWSKLMYSPACWALKLFSHHNKCYTPQVWGRILYCYMSRHMTKTNKMSVRPVRTQPGHPPSLIRVFAAQADLSLGWVHTHFVGFGHLAAHIPNKSLLRKVPCCNKHHFLSISMYIALFLICRIASKHDHRAAMPLQYG